MQTADHTTQYNHKEAYCLMWYQSKGGHKIRIWNSRDGVTPFIIYICGQEYQHVMWQLDDCQPGYKLSGGDLYFRDFTEDEAKFFAKRRLDSCKGTAYEVPENSEHYERTLSAIIEDIYKDGKSPKLDIF